MESDSPKHPPNCLCDECLAILEDSPATSPDLAPRPVWPPLANPLTDLRDWSAIGGMLGTMIKRLTYEWERDGLSSEKAESRAKEEMEASLRAANVDLSSYYEVRAWKKLFSAERFGRHKKRAGNETMRAFTREELNDVEASIRVSEIRLLNIWRYLKGLFVWFLMGAAFFLLLWLFISAVHHFWNHPLW